MNAPPDHADPSRDSEHHNEFGQPIGAPLPSWESRAAPPRTPMTGRYARLEPMSLDEHAHDLYDAFIADDRVWTYLSVGPFDSFDSFEQWMRRTCFDDDPLFHTIIDTESNRAVGFASYLRIAPAVGSIEVGYINFSPALQRTRAATEAMFLMMQRAFDELGYRRYEWKCDALNAGSRAAAERFGFVFEGVFRKATVYKGRSRDTAWYSITDTEWAPIRSGFQAWLEPTNFDETGRQRAPLTARPSPVD